MKMKLTRAIAFVLCPMLAMADVTLSENVTLTADADWRSQGVVTVPSGVTVDVNGHTLWLAGLAGGDRKASLAVDSNRERAALMARPLESLKPMLPRTEENFRKVLREILNQASQTR